MNFKIDTKEKFVVLMPEFNDLTANMAEALVEQAHTISEQQETNLILKMSETESIEQEAVEILARGRMEMYEKNKSFVVCEFKDELIQKIKEWEMDEAINYTPTESEAWDIVQMDEIEREFLAEG